MKKFSVLLFLVFALGIGNASAQQTAYDLAIEGQKKYGAGDHNAAMALFDSAIRLDPNQSLAHSYRGLILTTRKDYDGALAAYTRAIEGGIASKAEPKNYAGNYGSRAKIKFDHKKDVDGAIADWTIAIEKAGPIRQTSYRAGRAEAYTVKGNHEGAIADYTEIIRLSPDAHIWYTLRARSYQKAGKTALAEADEQKAAELKKK